MKIIVFPLSLLLICIAFPHHAGSTNSFVSANAHAWSNPKAVHLSAQGFGYEMEVGGYNLTCTGKRDLAQRFVGTTSAHHSNTLENPKRPGECSSSIGGKGLDGKPHQDYAHDKAA